jgi:hypothetical protein
LPIECAGRSKTDKLLVIAYNEIPDRDLVACSWLTNRKMTALMSQQFRAVSRPWADIVEPEEEPPPDD